MITLIEDIPELYNIKVALHIDQEISSVVKVPQNEDIAFTQGDGKLEFTVDKMKNHQLIVINKA